MAFLPDYTREQKHNQENFYKQQNQQTQPEEDPTPANTYDDDTLWLEINTEPILENLYNHWLGKKKVNGVWVEDQNATPIMNKELADKIINILRMKVNPQTLISGYTEEEIKKIALETCILINNSLMFEVEYYGLSISDFTLLVRNQIKHFIIQNLNMGKDYINTKLRFGSRTVNIMKRDENQGGMM